MLRTFAAAGISRGDIVQNAFGYGLFTGGLGAHYGLEAIGATVVPVSGGNTDRQVMLLRDFRVNAICATPSYFLHLIERAAELGIDLRDLPLRAGVFGAEPWTPEMRQRIEADAGIKAFDIYGLSEIIGPGVASECSAQMACTCSRTISTPRSSTRKPARCCPTARRASWCSPPCRSARCR
jgi:phenylacetate-CoA ligase